jgi:predicted GIY-YIG superfamily endonuclease
MAKKRKSSASDDASPPPEGPGPRRHHYVYVVYLRNPKGDGKAAYYVGMTGLSPEQRFQNHKNGHKAARIVKRCGERLVPRLYAHLNPMPYARAVEMEVMLADSLRKRGFVVYGGH